MINLFISVLVINVRTYINKKTDTNTIVPLTKYFLIYSPNIVTTMSPPFSSLLTFFECLL